MKLENSFTIDAPVDKAWEALNSPETVAPCFPGATLTSYEGDAFSGTVKVKLGPIAMTYKGKGTYVTRDEAAHEVVIDATGRDSRGNGTASAKVTASLAADGPDRTAVTMVTDMTITGKPAQFGRGVISDVADKIIGQFSACVARKLAPAPAAAASGAAAAGPVSAAEAPAADTSSASTVHFPASATSSSSNGAVAGTSEAEAPASGILDAVTPNPLAVEDGGTSEADAPASDLVGGRAPAPETAAGPVPGTSEAEAPAADMGRDSRAASTVVSPAPSPIPRASSPSASSPLSSAPRSSALQGGPIRSEVDAIDLFDTAGAPVLKRLAPVAGAGVLVLLVVLLVRWLRSR